MNPAAFDDRRNPLGKSYGAEGMMTLETSGRINFFYGIAGGNNDPYVHIGSPGCSLNEWQHMVLVRDMSTRKIRWYRDGVKGHEKDVPYEKVAESSLPFHIGIGYRETFLGMMDDVRIYDRALSEQEVALLYKSAPPAR
jgi:hypothetical protein